MEWWVGGCRRELPVRILIWNQPHLLMALRESEDFYNSQRRGGAPEGHGLI